MTQSTFKSIDHVLVRVKDAGLMMNLFANQLGPPVPWPLQTNDVATYGCVTLGNTNLEFWAASNNGDLPSDDVLPLFHGLALEPGNLADSIGTLASRGINCKAPRPYVPQTENGRNVTNFTNSVVLDGLVRWFAFFFVNGDYTAPFFRGKKRSPPHSASLKSKSSFLPALEVRWALPG